MIRFELYISLFFYRFSDAVQEVNLFLKAKEMILEQIAKPDEKMLRTSMQLLNTLFHFPHIVIDGALITFEIESYQQCLLLRFHLNFACSMVPVTPPLPLDVLAERGCYYKQTQC